MKTSTVLVLALIVVVVVFLAWQYQNQSTTEPPKSFDSARQELVDSINQEQSPIELQKAVVQFESRIDSFSMPDSEKQGLRDLAGVYSGFTGFLAFSASHEQTQRAIEDLQFGEYCTYKEILVLEAEQEQKAIEALELFKQKLAEFKKKYPEKAVSLNLNELDFSDVSTSEWKQANQEKKARVDSFAATCGETA